MLKFYSVGFIEKSDAKELKLSEGFGNLKIHVWLSPREGWQGRSRKSPPEKHILVGHSRVVLSEGTSGQGPRFLAYTETAAVNLQTFSRDSAVTDAQSVWWADGISSEGQISPSSSSCPADESCVYRASRDIRTCCKRHRKYLRPQTTAPGGLHVTDRVDSSFAQLTQKAQNSPPAFIVCMFSYSDVLLNLR